METVLQIYSNNISFIDLEKTNFEHLFEYENLIFYQLSELDVKAQFILDKLEKAGKKFLFVADRNMDESVQKYLNIKFKDFHTKDSQRISINTYHPITSMLDEERNFVFNDFWEAEISGNVLLSSNNYPLVVESGNCIVWLFDIEDQWLFYN